MKLILLLTLVLLQFAGCAPVEFHPPESVDELLSGQLLLGRSVDVGDIESDQILALDDEMRAYVNSKVQGMPHAKSRLRQLIKGMIDDGLLSLDYDPNLTQTASETFHRRQGNCLSFSNLFVAMAREADLDVEYQMVKIPPSFSADGDLVLLNNHINIRVSKIRSDTNFNQDYVVDFNTAEYNGNYDTKKVPDEYAQALYFSNIAVEYMQDGDTTNSFRYLKKAILTYSEIPGLWVNLGALYSRNGHFDLAVSAYHQALSIQSSNKSALVNLSNTLTLLGRDEEAEYYLRQVSYYRNHNPYYHYFLGQAAFQAGQYEEALAYLDEAISLKKDEHQFYYLQGLSFQKLSAFQSAKQSFGKAKKTAERNNLVSGYERKLQALESRLQ